MPIIDQMNWQGNRFFVAEGRVAGRDNTVKEKVTVGGNVSLAFTLNVGYAKLFDPNGKNEDEKGQRWTHSMHNIYCKIYAAGDHSNFWQMEEARTLQYREHVVVFGKIYETKANTTEEDDSPYVEYRVESILFPERMASMLANGNTVDLSRIHAPAYPPIGSTEGKDKPGGAKQTEEVGEEWF